MLTCCPACRTCFRVTDAQLAVAQGKVRCGKCKTVFNARQHLQTAAGEKPPAARPEPAVRPTPPAAAQQPDTIADEEIGHIDLQASPETSEPEPESPAAEDAEPAAVEIPQPEFEPEPATDTKSVTEPEQEPARYTYNSFTDEVGEQQDLDEILAEMNQQLSMGIDSAAPEPTEPFDLPRSAPSSDANQSGGQGNELSEAIDHLFDDLQAEADDDALDIEEEFLNEAEAQAESDAESRPADAEETAQLSEELDFVGEHPPSGGTEAKIEAEQDSDAVPFRLRESLKTEPPKRRGRLAILGGLLLILLLLGGVAVQLILFRPLDVVQLVPASQPYIQQLCQQAPCEFHYRQDLEQLQLLNRDVRAHPKQPNALLITATIINQAEFKQPYPILMVSLFDLSGNAVAQRQFVPDDYLGELASPFLLMTPQTPVQITLEVKDPGNDAINFEFDFK